MKMKAIAVRRPERKETERWTKRFPFLFPVPISYLRIRITYVLRAECENR